MLLHHVGIVFCHVGTILAPFGLHLGFILRSGGSREAFREPFVLRQGLRALKHRQSRFQDLSAQASWELWGTPWGAQFGLGAPLGSLSATLGSHFWELRVWTLFSDLINSQKNWFSETPDMAEV